MQRDDIKYLAKMNKERETLTQTIRVYSEVIGMEFGIGK